MWLISFDCPYISNVSKLVFLNCVSIVQEEINITEKGGTNFKVNFCIILIYMYIEYIHV